jgi:hypothetical protein
MTRTATNTALAALILALATLFSTNQANAQPPAFQISSGGQAKALATGSYYSPRLKARFLLQHMSVPGYSFWGARVVDMDFNSPLRNINLHIGDVVTRLDGVRVSNRRYQQTDPVTGGLYWAIPQMERHYSYTHVRFIRTGTTLVQQLTVNLGPWNMGGGIGGGGIAP